MMDELKEQVTEHTPTIEERMSAMLDRHSELAAENAALKAEISQRQILDELTHTARLLKIPESVVAHDMKHYIPDFIIKDGRPVLRLDETKDVRDVLTALQKERLHWQPTSRGACSWDEPMRATSTANNFAATVERQASTWFDQH